MTDEDLFNYLNTHRIQWQFNLWRDPWWGGFFEKLVGIMKDCLSKVIGRALLTFEELEESLLDVECVMNNRPLCYQGEEFEQPVLTPNILVRGCPAQFLEEDLQEVDEETALMRRMKFVKTSREHLKKRWITEYIHALEERSRVQHSKGEVIPKRGSVVMITDNSKIKQNWRIGRIIDDIVGKDGVVRGYRLRTGRGFVVERPLQLVCDLEIGSVPDNEPEGSQLQAEP